MDGLELELQTFKDYTCQKISLPEKKVPNQVPNIFFRSSKQLSLKFNTFS